jgi:[acyl-carrier-protein] S-malonyltransferase
MGKELVKSSPAAKNLFALGSEIVGIDLREKINAGELESTQVVQPAVFAVSLAALLCAKENGIQYSAAAGHSLGEYAALVSCGVMDAEEGFAILKIRSRIMAKAGEKNPGGMAAVIGLEAKKIEEICNELTESGYYVTAVNYNSPQQTVIAGTEPALVKAEEALKAAGCKKFMKLNVSAAFHSELMREAAVEFKKAIKSMPFKVPSSPFYSNYTGDRLDDYEKIIKDVKCMFKPASMLNFLGTAGNRLKNAFEAMPEYLASHLCSPVRFTDQLHAMKRDGYDTFLELGPGKVVSGLVKKTLPDATVCNIEDLKSLEAAKGILL